MTKFTITLTEDSADLINDILPKFLKGQSLTAEERFNILLNHAIEIGLVKIKDEVLVDRKVDVKISN